MNELVNRVAQSSLVTLDLQKHYPTEPIIEYDIKQDLFKEMILKERDFRKSLKDKDWSEYQGAVVCVFCSVDAVIPMWAYMMITSYLEDYAHTVYAGTKQDYVRHQMRKNLDEIDWNQYEDGKIILRGCSDQPLPPDVYLYATKKLRPLVSSLMFGEACSAVPIYKRRRKV